MAYQMLAVAVGWQILTTPSAFKEGTPRAQVDFSLLALVLAPLNFFRRARLD